MTDNINNPYQTPKSVVDAKLVQDTGRIWRMKSAVVVTRETIWPKRCIKCNAPTEKSIKRVLVYVNPWVYLSVLISLLITIVLVLIFQKKFKMHLPLCDQHITYRKRIILTNWMLFLVACGGLWGSIDYNTMYGYLLSGIAVFAMIIIGFSNRLAYISRYKDPHIYVKGAKQAFLDSLGEFDQS